LRLGLLSLLVLGSVMLTGRSAIADGDPGITFLSSPSSTTCGSAQNLEVVVNGSNRLPVANGTSITFTTSLGYVISPAVTNGGVAVVSLVIPPKQSGTADVRASGAGFNATKSIAVTCPMTTAPLFLAPVAPVAPRPAGAPQAAMPQPAAVTPMAVNMNMFEYGYAPSGINVRAGQGVSLNLTNSGRLPHTFTIAGVTNSGNVSPGMSRTLPFTAPAPGTYTFYCTIHGANVMSGRLTVTP
jgi:plastocyanin